LQQKSARLVKDGQVT